MNTYLFFRVRRFQRYGLVKLYGKNFIKERESDLAIQPIGLGVVFPAFLLLISFICLLVIIFIFEKIIWKLKHQNLARQ